MQNIGFTLFLILTLSLFCYPQTKSEEYIYISEGVRNPLIIPGPKAEAEILKSRWDTIGEELKTTEHSLAGTYVKPGYRGWYLRWSPKMGFVYIFHYEDIDVIDYSYGKAWVNGQDVSFIPEREFKIELSDKTLLTPKSWVALGEYLVPKNQIKDFADYLAGLGEYNNWECECAAFFVKPYSGNAPPLIIPSQYKRLFRPSIEGEIIAVGNSKVMKRPNAVLEITIPVRVNIGRKHGVIKGLSLRFRSDDSRSVVITKVNENFSLGTVADYDFEEGRGKPFPPIQTGTKVTSKLALFLRD